MRFYEALGVEPKLMLDAQDLQRRFYERSRQWHPDRFARASAAEQQKALEMTAVLNDAFRTLRDPVMRAGYFLEERHVASSKHPPAELLEEVFEMNMALEELRAGDESVRLQLMEARDRFVKLLAEIDHGLSALFIQYDKSLRGTPDESLLLAIRGALDRRQYVSNLIRDVEKELNVHVSN
jgi:molecular chaperone HscB